MHGTVLVAGGGTQLGQHLARWAAEDPATHVLLPLSPADAAAPGIAALREELQDQLTIAVCDLADRETVARLLADIPAEHPLSAVLFVAASTASPDLSDPDAIRRERAEIAGAENLDELTREHELSMFLVASPAGTTLGIPGKGRRGVAHGALEAVTRHRRSAGQTALFLMVAPEDDADGYPVAPPEAVLSAIKRLPGIAEESLVIADIAWETFIPALGQGATHLFRGVPAARRLLEAAQSAAAHGELVLDDIPEAERLSTLTDRIRLETASVLGHDAPAGIAPGDEFLSLGLTSFTALELSVRLSLTGVEVRPSDIFDHQTPAALAAYICTKSGAGISGGRDTPRPGHELEKEPS
jgi:NAD(P)-dependent dehydrogenase (short-subunit alcohol dehydrogenase family)